MYPGQGANCTSWKGRQRPDPGVEPGSKGTPRLCLLGRAVERMLFSVSATQSWESLNYSSQSPHLGNGVAGPHDLQSPFCLKCIQGPLERYVWICCQVFNQTPTNSHLGHIHPFQPWEPGFKFYSSSSIPAAKLPQASALALCLVLDRPGCCPLLWC